MSRPLSVALAGSGHTAERACSRAQGSTARSSIGPSALLGSGPWPQSGSSGHISAPQRKDSPVGTLTSGSTDHLIRAKVQTEIASLSEVESSRIGVGVHHCVVTLSGEVGEHSTVFAAKRAACRVKGVTTIVNDLTLHSAADEPATEADIAQGVTHALGSAINVPDGVQVEIRDHVVILSGQVERNVQRMAAVRAVQHLPGVHSVDNRLVLAHRTAEAEDRLGTHWSDRPPKPTARRRPHATESAPPTLPQPRGTSHATHSPALHSLLRARQHVSGPPR
ncbi:BON domain-containing protein [Nesterenkonia lutea]|uniref:BON domain-containing protein n=1 Tax=Nesterenkonia lutea TaxID=272919 RepID=UPI001CEF47F9